MGYRWEDHQKTVGNKQRQIQQGKGWKFGKELQWCHEAMTVMVLEGCSTLATFARLTDKEVNGMADRLSKRYPTNSRVSLTMMQIKGLQE